MFWHKKTPPLRWSAQGWTRPKITKPDANEDAFSILQKDDYLFVAIADGQGGRPGGREAAILAVESAGKLSSETYNRKNLRHLLEAVDQAVSTDKQAGYCSFTFALFENDHLRGATCGDCMLLAVTDNEPSRNLTFGQAKNPPVGSGNASAYVFEDALKENTRLLLATDGLWRVLREDGLVNWLRSGGSLMDLEAAYLGEHESYMVDDSTAVFVHAL